MTETKPITFPATIQVSRQRVSDLLCCALEGGSNYWYEIREFVKPTAFTFYTDREDSVFKHLDYPLNEGGQLHIADKNDSAEAHTTHILCLGSIAHGLTIMSGDPRYKRHWQDFLDENEDADTGDVFLQLCLYGEVVFG